MRFLRDKKGFSLVELMTVVVVMSILVAVAIPTYQGISKSRRLDDCTMNRTMISSVVQEGMNGMFDSGKKQPKILMKRVPDTKKITIPADDERFPAEYRGRECFVLINKAGTIPVGTGSKEVYPFTLGDLRGGYRGTITDKYDVGCELGFYLKKKSLEDSNFYQYMANAEIPQCAFEEANDQEYYYYIFDDATVLCSCPECLEAIKDALD